MLKYNFDRVEVLTFLRQAGFSDNLATKVKNSRMKRLNVDTLERLCIKIGCTPNDFMDWTADKENSVDISHHLNELNRMDKIVGLTKTLNLLPLSKLEEIERLINENK